MTWTRPMLYVLFITPSCSWSYQLLCSKQNRNDNNVPRCRLSLYQSSFKILRQNNIRRIFLKFSDPIVEVMHSEFSGRSGPLILYLLPSTKGTIRKIWQYMCENLKILENWAIVCTKQKQGRKGASFRNGYMS